jgi:single-strand DNA-binding protein
VANFSLATNERAFSPGGGDSEIKTEWHRIVSWGKQAEFCEKYLNKGKQILVEGRLRTEKWQDRDGNPRSTTKVHAISITLLGKRDESGGGESFGGPPSSTDSFPSESKAMPDIQSGDDDDVPF